VRSLWAVSSQTCRFSALRDRRRSSSRYRPLESTNPATLQTRSGQGCASRSLFPGARLLATLARGVLGLGVEVAVRLRHTLNRAAFDSQTAMADAFGWNRKRGMVRPSNSRFPQRAPLEGSHRHRVPPLVFRGSERSAQIAVGGTPQCMSVRGRYEAQPIIPACPCRLVRYIPSGQSRMATRPVRPYGSGPRPVF
jgi:hypothetical protein